MFKPGDCVIYAGRPAELNNGEAYLVTEVGTDTITLLDYGTHLAKNFYQMRDFDGNDDSTPTYHYDPTSGEWIIPFEGLGQLNLRGVYPQCTEEKLQSVLISDVGGIGWDLPDRMRGLTCACCGGRRFITADMNKPIFLIDGLHDPHLGRRYRQMDGKHRTAKRIHFGYTHTPAYVFHIDELMPYIN